MIILDLNLLIVDSLFNSIDCCRYTDTFLIQINGRHIQNFVSEPLQSKYQGTGASSPRRWVTRTSTTASTQQLRVQLGMKYDHHLIYLFIVIVNHLFFSAVRMTPIQRRLYRRFMEELITNRCVSDPLKAFAVCCKIWNHSDVLHNYLLKREKDDLYLLEAEAECAPSPAPPGGRPWGPESVLVCQE